MLPKIQFRDSVITFVGFALILISTSVLGGDRNSKESVAIQNSSQEISKDNITFILELKKRREELSFQQASTLPNSSSNYSASIFKIIRKNVANISATIDEVKNNNDIIKAALVSSEKGWKDGNVIFYIPTLDGYRVVSSFEEIERFAHLYAHREFKEQILKEVDDLLSEVRKDNKRLRKFHEKKVREQSLNEALGILENEIRKLGAEEKGPILANGWSPKLTNALKDPKILQKIENSDEPAVKRAFEYLKKEKIIKINLNRN